MINKGETGNRMWTRTQGPTVSDYLECIGCLISMSTSASLLHMRLRHGDYCDRNAKKVCFSSIMRVILAQRPC